MNKKLDIYQQKAITNADRYTLLIAPAGSGKTFTITEKIDYLIKNKNIKENEILCISFTNKSVESLNNKLKEKNYNILCYTFHKLGLEILKKENYKIVEYKLLEYIIDEYFTHLINSSNKKRVLRFLNIQFNNYNYNNKYLNISKNNMIQIKTITNRFINLFKANNYNKNNFEFFIKQESNKKAKDFLIVILYIYLLYQSELESRKEIDFNDMISLATLYVENNGYDKKIKYLIIDEFQDTSKVRFDLIKAILNKTGASFLAVGDDFQSIYRFTGCDLDLFLNFKNYFKDSTILKLKNTYRNSNELINIASNFIMKNNNQIKKDVASFKSLNRPIEIIYYFNIKKAFLKLINKIYINTNKPILILGRNNNDINMILNKDLSLEKDSLIYKKNLSIKMKYLTVHKAKGLEEENVIIINLKDDILGFPNKIKDNKLLKYVTCKTDQFPYSEERRLFYVALTRTKNKVYLLTPVFKKSAFVKELIKKTKL